MGKAIKHTNGQDDEFDFDAAFKQAAGNGTAVTTKKQVGKNKAAVSDNGGFDFDAAFKSALKKKDEPISGKVSSTGTENISPSKSPLESTTNKPTETNEERYAKIAEADAEGLLNNFKQTSKHQFSEDVSDFDIFGNNRPYQDYLQSREGKAGKIVSDIVENGKFNPSDINYLAKVAPTATRQLMKSLLPGAGNILSKENIDRLVSEGSKVVDNSITEQKIKNNISVDQNVKKSLSSVGINPAQLQDEKYAEGLAENFIAKKNKELTDLEKQFPETLVSGATGVSGSSALMSFRQNESEYNQRKSEIENKYSDLQNKIGLSKAFDYAKQHPAFTPKQIGEQWLKYANPDTYTLWEKNGRKGAIDRDMAEVGVRALYGTGFGGAVELAKKDEERLDYQYPDKIKAETRHRLGAELYKSQNWFFNAAPSVKELDKAAEQIPEKYRDIYYKFIREEERRNVGTDVPMSGLANKFGEATVSTAIETWKGLGDFLNVRSEKKVAQEALDEGIDTDFQNVGAYQPAVARLKELKAKQKKDKELSPNEIIEKQDLETFTGVRSIAQELIDGTGNLTGQVWFQALGTKGLGAVVSAGTKGLGLLKAANVVKGLAAEEAIAADAMAFGISKPLITDISAMAVAYASSYDAAKRDAFRLMPNDKDAGKRTLYSTIVAGLNAVTERIFKDEKILNAFNKEISPNIKTLVSKLSEGKISKDLLSSEIAKILKSSGSFLKESGIQDTKEAIEEVASSVGQSVATAILAPSKFNRKASFDDAVSTFTTMFLHGGLVAGLAGAQSFRANHIGIPTLSKLGIDEKLTDDAKSFINAQTLNGNMSQEEANGKFKILNTASRINTQVMPQVDAITKLPQKAREKYAVQLLNEKILTGQAEDSKDPVLKSNLEKKVKESEKVRQQILGKEIFVDDNYSVKTPEQINLEQAQEITAQDIQEAEENLQKQVGEEKTKEATEFVNGLVDNNDIGSAFHEMAKTPISFLQFAAQQAANISPTGEPLEGSNQATLDQLTPTVISYAKELFPNIKPITDGNKKSSQKAGEESGQKSSEEAIAQQGNVKKQSEGAAQDETVPSVVPNDIHVAAKDAGIDYESKEFMDKSEELTGERHLDKMNPVQLQKVKDFISEKKSTKLFDEKLPLDIKYADVIIKDLVTGKDQTMSASKAKKQIEKQHNMLEKLVNCLTK